MAVTIIKRRLINPQKNAKAPAKKVGSRRAQRPAHRKANPGELIALGFVNPQKGTSVKNKKKSSKKTARQKNPFPFKAAKAPKAPYRPKKWKRNPENLSLTKPMEVAKATMAAFGGLVATRQLPQLVLGANNTGYLGWGANLAVAAAMAALVGMKNKTYGSMVLLGGSMYLVNRVIAEKLSPVGKVLSLAGVGDAQAAASLGRIKEAYFPYPVIYDKAGNPIIPPQIDARRALAAAQAAAAPFSKVS